MRDIKTVFGQQIYLKWNHCLLRRKTLINYYDAFTKYAWVKPLKDKKGKTVFNAFIEIVNESNRKSMG